MLYVPDRRIIKPPTCVGLSNSGSSVLRGLRALIPFNEMVGKPRCLPRAFTGTFQGTLPPAWTPRDEPCLFFSLTTGGTGTAYVDFGTPTDLQDLSLSQSPFSCAARIWKISGQASAGIVERNDGNTVNAGWSFGLGSGGVVGLAIELSTSNRRIYSTAAAPTGKFTNVAVAWDGSLVSAAGSNAAIDGVVSALTGAGGSGTQGTDAADHLYVGRSTLPIGADTTTAGVFSGWISWIAIWNRQLNAGELAYVTSDPFALFMRSTILRGMQTIAPFNPNTMAWSEDDNYQELSKLEEVSRWEQYDDTDSASALLPGAPPTAFEPDDVSKFDAGWRVPQHLDEETQSNKSQPTIFPPVYDVQEPEDVSKLDAGWRANQLTDEETQSESFVAPVFPPSYDAPVPDDISKFDAGWRANQLTDEDTQRAIPPPPPTAQEPEDVTKFDAGWRAHQYSDEGTESNQARPTIFPPPYDTQVPDDSLSQKMVLPYDRAAFEPGFDQQDNIAHGPQSDLHAMTFFAAEGGPNPASKEIDISSIDMEETTWTGTSNAAWLTITPGSGAIPEDGVQINVNITGLAPGVYKGKITLS